MRRDQQRERGGYPQKSEQRQRSQNRCKMLKEEMTRGRDRKGEIFSEFLLLLSVPLSPFLVFLPPSNQDISPDNVYFSKLARMLSEEEGKSEGGLSPDR